MPGRRSGRRWPASSKSRAHIRPAVTGASDRRPLYLLSVAGCPFSGGPQRLPTCAVKDCGWPADRADAVAGYLHFGKQVPLPVLCPGPAGHGPAKVFRIRRSKSSKGVRVYGRPIADQRYGGKGRVSLPPTTSGNGSAAETLLRRSTHLLRGRPSPLGPVLPSGNAERRNIEREEY